MEEKIRNTDHLIEMTNTLNSMRKKSILTDFTLECNGIPFPVHKAVISSCSEYFNKSIQHDPRSTSANVSGIPAAVLEILLEYMYTGNLVNLDSVIIGNVLASANLFCLNSLLSKCIPMMLKNISDENILEFLKVTEEYQVVDMKHAITKHLVTNFKSLIESDILGKIPLEYMKQVISQNVSTCSSDELFQAVLKWTEFDQVATRTKNVDELMKWIDVDKLSTDYLLKVSDNPVVLNNSSLMEKILKVNSKRLKQQVSLDSCGPNISCDQNKVPDEKYASKCSYSVSMETDPLNNGIKVTLGHISNVKEDEYVERFKIVGFQSESKLICYDLEKDSEETFTDPIDIPVLKNKCSLHLCSICFHDGQIYFLGGKCKNSTALKSTFALDIRTKQWERKADMNMARCRPKSASMETLIYIVGGCDNDARAFECYNASSNTWTVLPPMHLDMSPSTAFAFQDSLYVIGLPGHGLYRSDTLQMQKYNPRLAEWTEIKTIPPFTENLFSIVNVTNVAGKMFALHTGISGSHFDICEFEPASGTWHKPVSMLFKSVDDFVFFGNCDDNICIVTRKGSVMLISPDNMKILKRV